MAKIDHSDKLEADERGPVRIEAGMRIANLKGGGRRITHPSGVACIESRADRERERQQLIADVNNANRRLSEFNLEEA
jgi:hypothetical protein